MTPFKKAKEEIARWEGAVEAKRAECDLSAERLHRAMLHARESIDILLAHTLPAPVPEVTHLQEYRAMVALIRADEDEERGKR